MGRDWETEITPTGEKIQQVENKKKEKLEGATHGQTLAQVGHLLTGSPRTSQKWRIGEQASQSAQIGSLYVTLTPG